MKSVISAPIESPIKQLSWNVIGQSNTKPHPKLEPLVEQLLLSWADWNVYLIFYYS